MISKITKQLTKIASALVVLFMLAVVPVQAQYNSTTCNDPSSSVYSSEQCLPYQLGLEDINDEALIKRNPAQLITTVVQFFLAIVIIVVIFRLVIVGLGVANAKADADARKEQITKAINSLIGLVVAFSVFGLSIVINNALGQDNVGEIVDCSDIPATVPTTSPLWTRCTIATQK